MTNEELEPIASDVRALLEQERAVPDVSLALTAELQARLADTLGVALAKGAVASAGAAVTASVAAPKVALLAAWPLAKVVPVLIAFAVGGAVGSVATLAVTKTSAPVAAVAAPQALPVPTPVVQAPVEAAPIEAGPGQEPPEAAVAAPSAVVAAPSAQAPEERVLSDRELREERQLLELARSALARQQAQDAFDALQRHAQRFPKGRLAEERDSLRVLALALLGRNDEARAAAVRFRKRYPSSLFGSVVDRALEAIP